MDENLLFIAENLDIPVKTNDQKIWLLRTEAGKYYIDFKKNSFVALGWNRIPKELIQNDNLDFDEKKARVQELYPDEKRPGLIFSQMQIFYMVMKKGDIIIIPSEGSRNLSIGVLGELIPEIEHEISDEDYIKCEFEHKREVVWMNDADQTTDVYLGKVLKSHQTISDITEYSTLIYRNMFDIYMDDKSLHLTLFKKSNNEFNFTDYITFFNSINSLAKDISRICNETYDSNTIYVKSAVGSPGFIEIVSLLSSVKELHLTPFVLVSIIALALGKNKNSDGNISTGICAILNQVNTMVNDHKNRQLIDAEIEEKKAEVRLKNAEANRYELETIKQYQAPVTNTINENADHSNNTNEEQPALTVSDISPDNEQIQGLVEPCEQIIEVASRNNITMDS